MAKTMMIEHLTSFDGRGPGSIYEMDAKKAKKWIDIGWAKKADDAPPKDKMVKEAEKKKS